VTVLRKEVESLKKEAERAGGEGKRLETANHDLATLLQSVSPPHGSGSEEARV
jgi:hypothetical protein